MAVSGLPRPDIRSYTCYRKFMEDYYLHRKSLRAGFSFRKFSDLSGVRSPNFLQLVMQRKRNMSEEVGARVAKVMALSASERDYFLALIRRDNAASDDERQDADRALLRAVNRLVSHQLSSAQAQVLSSWYHLVVREMTFLSDFEPSGEWISKHLRGLITPRQAEESLTLLRTSGFLSVDDASGRLRAVDPVVDTGDAFDFARVLNAHVQNLEVWQRILGEVSPREREIGLLNIPISSDRIPEFKRRIRAFQEEIIGWLQNETRADQVVQLGCYLVPLTRR